MTGSQVADDGRQLVLVLGPGRSGTSTIAGTLARCGFEVPGESIVGNNSNPAGFYEPRWVVDFHAELLERVGFGALSPDPNGAAEIRAATAERELVDRLSAWLSDTLVNQPHIVIKDPRTVWFPHLWAQASAAIAVKTRYVTMLRHPAEVSASRADYYGRGRGNKRRGDARRIAGWTNVALLASEVTVASLRCFVRYDELLSDWRTTMNRVFSELALTPEPAIASGHHPVDDFVDPSLNRHPANWDDVELPPLLQTIAEETWGALSDLAHGDGGTETQAILTSCRNRYPDAVKQVSEQLGIDLAARRPKDAETSVRKSTAEQTVE